LFDFIIYCLILDFNHNLNSIDLRQVTQPVTGKQWGFRAYTSLYQNPLFI